MRVAIKQWIGKIKKSTQVVSCEPEAGLVYCEELNADIPVWGIRVSFSDGQIVTVADISTRREHIDLLAKRLSGTSLSPDFLCYIIEDFLGEIWG